MKHSIVDLLEAYPIKEQKAKPPYQIYCDMDGVLTDFEERFDHFLGTTPSRYEEKNGTKEFWNIIDEIGDKFWSGMKWMPEGRKLWDFISPYDPLILTSPSQDASSRDGKKKWCEDNLNYGEDKIKFEFSADKQIFSNSNSILIDDKKSNIEQWISKGGIGIRCKDGNVDQVIKELQELGYE